MAKAGKVGLAKKAQKGAQGAKAAGEVGIDVASVGGKAGTTQINLKSVKLIKESYKERQREGIDLAKKRGVYKGRKRSLSANQVFVLQQKVSAGKKKSEVAAEVHQHQCKKAAI
ncbi:MAG: hypothetical protein ACX93T_00635 [Bacteroidota bacterium]